MKEINTMDQYIITLGAFSLNCLLCSAFATSVDVFLISNAIIMAAMIVKGTPKA